MSVALDTIDRELLIKILETITSEGQLKLVQFPISRTSIKTQINGATKYKTVESNIGTPQRDGLSHVLFTIYVEHALLEVRANIPTPVHRPSEHLPTK